MATKLCALHHEGRRGPGHGAVNETGRRRLSERTCTQLEEGSSRGSGHARPRDASEPAPPAVPVGEGGSPSTQQRRQRQQPGPAGPALPVQGTLNGSPEGAADRHVDGAHRYTGDTGHAEQARRLRIVFWKQDRHLIRKAGDTHEDPAESAEDGRSSKVGR